jgi:hypothetical protein
MGGRAPARRTQRGHAVWDAVLQGVLVGGGAEQGEVALQAVHRVVNVVRILVGIVAYFLQSIAVSGVHKYSNIGHKCKSVRVCVCVGAGGGGRTGGTSVRAEGAHLTRQTLSQRKHAQIHHCTRCQTAGFWQGRHAGVGMTAQGWGGAQLGCIPGPGSPWRR